MSERIKAAFNLKSKVKQGSLYQVIAESSGFEEGWNKRKSEMAEIDDQAARFLIWAEKDDAFLAAFIENAATWQVYLDASRTLTRADIEKTMGSAGPVEEARGLLDLAKRKASVGAPTVKTKEQRTEENAAKKQAELEKAKSEKEAEEEREKEEEKRQAKLVRQAAIASYAHIPGLFQTQLAQTVWQLAIDCYVDGVANKNQTLGGAAHAVNVVETALADWAARRGRVQQVGGVISDLSNFSEVQNKDALGKGNVGATLDTRKVQGNFILRGPDLNVHVNAV